MMRKGPLTLLTTLLLTVLLAVIIGVTPAIAIECCDCHGNVEAVHGNFDHTATPGNAPVTIFPDTGHDNSGWVGAKPYFAVTVACDTCHNSQLAAIHGNDCATCHPTLYATLGIWERGCQQISCHASFHNDSTKAHLLFEDAFSSTIDCNLCHNQSWDVPQENCLNCHATYGSEDTTPPVTTSKTQAEYIGSASIGFSITDNGKVGVGRTFYQLDNGTVIAAGKNIFITTPGSHELKFWSMDQSGNTESTPNTVFFTIVADTTPPSTTSNAKATYNQSAVITLSASDASNLGVKTTFYRLNGGPILSGTKVVVPATSGVCTLAFWSEDWTGNIEPEKSVTFTVALVGGLRLVWGNSDWGGSPCPGDEEAQAKWTIKRGTTVVTTGYGACPNWSGVNNVTVPVSTTPYSVSIVWWDSWYETNETSSFNAYVTIPGQVIRLSY